jgi:hypothetical protein
MESGNCAQYNRYVAIVTLQAISFNSPLEQIYSYTSKEAYSPVSRKMLYISSFLNDTPYTSLSSTKSYGRPPLLLCGGLEAAGAGGNARDLISFPAFFCCLQSQGYIAQFFTGIFPLMRFFVIGQSDPQNDVVTKRIRGMSRSV